MPLTLVLHHDDEDGFCSAWVASKYLPEDAAYMAVDYGQDPPDVAGKDVYVLDFSYKRPVLEAMAAAAHTIQVIDHHKSAQADLAGLPYCYFDMNHSGARLTLEWFAGHRFRPTRASARPLELDVTGRLVNYVEDRDLWRFALPYSKEVNAVVAIVERGFAQWDALAEDLGDCFQDVVRDGSLLLRQQRKLCERIVAATRMTAEIGGHVVPCINTPVLCSEAVELLQGGDVPFVAYFYHRGDGLTRFGLRSNRPGIDVSEVAGLYGGGGHKTAAGFQCEAVIISNAGARCVVPLPATA